MTPEQIRAEWVLITLDRLDQIDKIVMLGGATEDSDRIYHLLMKRVAGNERA